MPKASMGPPSRDHDTDPAGVPIVDAVTRAVCADCGGEAIKGGPIVPDEAMCRARWDVCAFGAGWRWCWARGRFLRQ